MYTCRECEKEINSASEVCPSCGADLRPPEEQSRAKPKLVSVLARYLVVVATVWLFLWYILPDRSSDPRAKAESAAVATLKEVNEAISAYAQDQNGVLPSTLDVLGDRIRPAAQQAQAEGYRLNYVLGPVEADGSPKTYALQARAGNFGYRNFFVDQTGVIRATSENRAATGQDAPI